MNISNPLIPVILKILRESAHPHTLLGLVDLCTPALKQLIADDENAEIAIFQKNFFMMNALYNIQKQILDEGYYLSISPVEILLIASASAEAARVAKGGESELAAYYLNWQNLGSVTVEEIHLLLTDFWKKYLSVDKQADALSILEVQADAEWTDIRAAYQRLASVNHPDKGGSREEFVRVREAYEVLKAARA